MKINIACGQIEITPGEPGKNTQAVLSAIAKAKKEGVDILLLPEMVVPGYLLGDLWEQDAFLEDCVTYGQEIIKATSGLTLVFGNVALDKNKLNEDGHWRKYNAAFVAQDGKLVSHSAAGSFLSKTCLPTYREFDDARYFYSAAQLAQELQKPLEDILQPVDITIKGEKFRLGVMLCEDGWTENYPHKVPDILAHKGADIICNISCSPFTLNKNVKRHKLFAAQAKSLHLPLYYCNAIGVQNNGKNIFTFDGCSSVYTNNGDVLASSPYFKEELLCTTLVAATKELSGPKATLSEPSETATIYEALSYGAKHFLNEAGIKKMTIGLSGGIDSAVAAAFYVHLLGAENVLLINMPSKYNSTTTRSIAEHIAKALKTNYAIMPIEDVVNTTINQLSTTTIQHFGDNSTFNLTVTPFMAENIQARDRGARLIAGAAAAFGGAFSCNANKAEAAVGYSTFYGDLAGCLAILGDLWKHQVYALGRFLNQQIYKREVLPEEIFTIAPSAELSSAQTVGVGGDPLIYPYHDYLLKAFVERWRKASPEDILTWYKANCLEERIGCRPGLVAELFPTPTAFIADLEKWWKLFTGLAIAKRIQAPPNIVLSPRAFGYDYREAQLSTYYSRKYLALKKELLK